jgi:hypothetical protein
MTFVQGHEQSEQVRRIVATAPDSSPVVEQMVRVTTGRRHG